jgi:hypothetical protein
MPVREGKISEQLPEKAFNIEFLSYLPYLSI